MASASATDAQAFQIYPNKLIVRHSDVKRFNCWIIGLAVTLLIAWFAVVPASKKIHPDFIAYYLTGWMVAQGETPSRIYEYPWFQRQTVYAGVGEVPGGIGYNPPTAALSLLPLGWLEPKHARDAWLVVNIAAAIALLAVLSRATGLPFVAGIVLLLFSAGAFRNNLIYGQIYLVLTFLVAAAIALRDAGWRWLAGTLLGVVTAVKLYTAPLLIYFIWRREWRTVIGFLVAISLVFAVSLSLLGWGIHEYWSNAVLPRAQQGFGDNPAINLQTWNNLLQQLFYDNETWNPDPPIRSHFAFWLVRDLGTLSLLVCGFYAARTRDNALGLCVVLLILPLISPSTRSYHLILYVVPIAYWGMYYVRQGSWRLAAAVTCLYFLAVSKFAYLHPDLFLRFGALLTITIVLLRELRPWRLPMWVFPSIVVVATIHAAIASQPRSQDTAIPVTPDISLVVSPTYRNGKLAYSAFSCPGCSGYTLRGDTPPNLKVTGHVFGTRFARDSGALFFELAENRHSEILAWSNDKLQRWTPKNMSCVAPSPSNDGTNLVAVCDGALYFFSAPGQGRPILRSDDEIADPDLSPDGSRVVFSWRRNGKWGVYQTDLAEREPVPVTKGDYNDRWPRFSPNGAWVAFSRVDPTADIWAIELKTGRELRITQDPGNDTEPAWSDDGKVLYFVSDRDRAIHQGSIYTIALPTVVTESESTRGIRSTMPQPQ